MATTAQTPPSGEAGATKATWLGVGALGSAVGVFASWLCCLFPLSMGVAGAAAAVGSRIEPFRPLLSALTVGFLAVAFYRAYRRPKGQCEEGEVCRRPRGRRLQRTLLWVVAALALTLLLAPYWAGFLAQWSL